MKLNGPPSIDGRAYEGEGADAGEGEQHLKGEEVNDGLLQFGVVAEEPSVEEED